MRQRVFLKGLGLLAILTILFAGSSSARLSTVRPEAELQPYVPGEVLVKLRDGPQDSLSAFSADAGLSALTTQLGVEEVAALFPASAASPAGLDRIFKLSLPKDGDVIAAVEALAADPGVEYAEPNYIFQLDDPTGLASLDAGGGAGVAPPEEAPLAQATAPSDGADPAAALAALPSGALLPFAGAQRFTSGPHGAIGNDVAICKNQALANMSGLDFAGGSFPVIAVAEGRYLGHAQVGAAGNFVLIEHSNGLQTMYWHLASVSAEVRGLEVGQWIPRGFPIGVAGNSGLGYTDPTTNVHLHLELRRGLTDASNPFAGTRVTWDGEGLDGWTFYAFRATGVSDTGINYRGSAVRGATSTIAITNVRDCADVRGSDTGGNAVVGEGYPATATTATNTNNGGNTVFANFPDSALMTSSNHTNRVTIGGAPETDFGGRNVGDNAEYRFRVHNRGGTPISGLSATIEGGAFSFKGGSYPGSGGTCGASLAGGQFCDLYLRFVPPNVGAYSGTLTVSHLPEGETTPLVAQVALKGAGNEIPPRTADDPLFAYQYGLNNTGQSGGRRDADIDAPEGWGVSTGNRSVLVAVVDSGIYYTHDDLNDGRVRTDIDWDYVNNDGDALDDNGHGTHVAGIIAAETNNGEGVAGVMWDAQLLPLKVCDRRGGCNFDHVAQAIRYAADKGARVINLSLGGSVCSNALTDAINYAHFTKGVVVVAASGNDGGGVGFPASLDAVIAVGASDRFDSLVTFSNRGPEQDLVAPGKDIWSTVPDNGYDSWSGTSMATPFVTGAAGVLIAQRPQLTNEQVRDILRLSADDRGTSGFDKLYGYGRLNLFKALQTPTPAYTKASAKGAGCPVCGATAAAAQGADGATLLANIRTLRDTVFQQDPGRRWAQIYYANQLEVALMVASDSGMRAQVLAGWRVFDPVFLRLMDEGAEPVILTPELIATAHTVMMGVAERGSPAVHDAIVSEWARVDPQRFVGWEVRDVWAQLTEENARPSRAYLPLVVR